MVTATNRSINKDQFEGMHNSAYSGGIDFTQNFNDRNYYVSLNTAFSNVNGSQLAIYKTQTSSERFFQRPDNYHQEVDSSKTSLSGMSASASFGKKNGNLIFQTGGTMRSPGFELNDVGFLVQTDYISQWTWAQYRILKPFGIFRWFRLNGNQYLTWDYDGVNLYKAVNFNSHMQFKNLWYLGGGLTVTGESVSNADLRGGPSIRYPGSREFWGYISSNDQKKLTFEINPWFAKGGNDYYEGLGIYTYLRYQPTDALRLSLSPSVEWNDNALQYVGRYSNSTDHFILGKISQVTYRASVRANYIVTPNLSVEYWGQPFISKGEYTNFQKVLAPSAESFGDRYMSYSENEITYDLASEIYLIDEDGDGSIEYELDDPNFNFLQFRSNFVVRWEYIPGSTLFLVWTSNASASHNSRQNQFRDLASDLRSIDGSNIFLIKYTYRFIL